MKEKAISVKALGIITAALFVAFAVFTVLVLTVDVQPIGPMGSEVGFAGMNGAVRDVFGASDAWYTVSELLGLVAISVVGGFCALGACQLVRRKSLLKVDAEILLLGVFCVLLVAFYALFEMVVINCRPILEDGALAASYPSSHTMLVCSVVGAASLALDRYIKGRAWEIVVDVVSSVVMLATVVGRLLSGVHWITDIIGALLLSAALVGLYATALTLAQNRPQEALQTPETNA